MNAELQINRLHSRSTRLSHMVLAATIVTQLISSLIMVPPLDGNAADIAFTIHQYSGVLAFLFALLFWGIIMARKKGTSLTSLIPWFSAERLRLLKGDILEHFAALKSFKLPDYKDDKPLASAVHGLGLLLMTGMAATGVAFAIAMQLGRGEETNWVANDLLLHVTFANLVWAYLIGHAGLAILHHFTSKASLSEMWSFRASGH
ncbi:cytochrome b/b6 domain-containing protein [Hoeflea sp. AS60]|uniref:cytochrome b/b6 domain-containing protein n=1 Tax=Hoeflea sp. AS60 TaxID=3135780 RepID=UPI00317688FD